MTVYPEIVTKILKKYCKAIKQARHKFISSVYLTFLWSASCLSVQDPLRTHRSGSILTRSLRLDPVCLLCLWLIIRLKADVLVGKKSSEHWHNRSVLGRHVSINLSRELFLWLNYFCLMLTSKLNFDFACVNND